MPIKPSRRKFMQASAAVGMGYWAAGGVSLAQSKSPNEQIQFACIGIGGKGRSDSMPRRWSVPKAASRKPSPTMTIAACSTNSATRSTP
jgi:uncharacterized protein (DUF1501 family)